jgi:NAD(P)-dependent dehydrogenase (short-subunit alcohol dehydrogenase family)
VKLSIFFNYQPSAEILDYATTKAVIVGFTRGLAVKMLDKGIRASCVASGPVSKPLIVSSYPKDEINQFGSDVSLNESFSHLNRRTK